MAGEERTTDASSVGGMSGIPAQAPSTAVPDIYAEGVSVQMGFNSVSLQFNRNFSLTPNAVPTAVVVGTIRMSPQQAKLLSIVLDKAVHEYEVQIGELKLPAAVLHQISQFGTAEEE